MKTLLVTPKSEHDFQFLNELLSKLGFESHVLYGESVEDIGLLKAMLQEKKGDYVSEKDIMKALGQNES